MNNTPVYVYLFAKEQQKTMTDIRNKIIKDAKGKPFFQEDRGEFLSISHSGNYTAVAIADCPVGVDLQRMDDKQEIYTGVVKRYFHEDEQAYVLKARRGEFLLRFFQVWCGKESYVKYTGTGIDEDFSSFSVFQLPEGIVLTCAGGAPEGYMLCVCHEGDREIMLKIMTEGNEIWQNY